MCGIAGTVGVRQDGLLEQLGASMHHRGPDGGGVASEGSAALVARRLAIVDLEGGDQPMTSPSGRCTIVFNGEIYNAAELRARLEREGRAFATDHSDTEVVLALWEERGEASLQELNGMFAFAILDRERGELVLVRDRLGIKPLYYGVDEGALAFASELKTLLQVPWIEPAVDPQSLFHYLSLRFVPGERSIVPGVRRLPPAHLLRFDLERREPHVTRWWKLTFGRDGNTIVVRCHDDGSCGGPSPTFRSPCRSRAAWTPARSPRCSPSRVHASARIRSGSRRRTTSCRSHVRSRRSGGPTTTRPSSTRTSCSTTCSPWCGRSTSRTEAGSPPGTSTASWPTT